MISLEKSEPQEYFSKIMGKNYMFLITRKSFVRVECLKMNLRSFSIPIENHEQVSFAKGKKYIYTYNIIEEVFLFKFPLLRLQLVSMIKSEKRKIHRSFLDPLDDITVIMSCRI